MEELRNLIISQGRGTTQASNGSFNSPVRERPHVEIAPDPVVVTPPARNDPPPARNYSTRISKDDFPRFDGKKVKD